MVAVVLSLVSAAAQITLIDGQCPQWINDYEKWHGENRGQPGTKYLVHQAVANSGGMGDRLRGMLYTVRVAYALQRVVLFTWSHPYNLDHFFVPGGSINWTLEGINYQAGRVLSFVDGPPNALVNGGGLINASDEFITFNTNHFMETPCQGCPPLESKWSAAAVCLWHRILKPAPDIITMAQEQLANLYNQSAPRYAAIHLRMGGLHGEHELERGRGPLKNFVGAVRCANDLSKSGNVSGNTPLLLISDNHHLRDFLASHNLHRVVSPSYQPVHTDHGDTHNVAAHKTSVVDMVLLGMSECLVTSPSGFSHMAWLYGGGKPCKREFLECI